MKKIFFLIALVLAVAMVAGCAGTPVVYYSDCTCPTGSHDINTEENKTDDTVLSDGELKTGLALITDISGSTDAAQAKYDVTVVAVTVDDGGVIRSCIIDSIGTSIDFDGKGIITSDLTAQVLSKNELGEDYGMKKAGSTYEWNEQAAALAQYAVGKTVEELKTGAVGEDGKAKDADLATTATIYLGGYVDGVEKAVANAQPLGAQSGDELILAAIPSLSGNDAGEKAGLAQLSVDVATLTVKDGVITSCAIDALQAKVNFDAQGMITTDLAAPVQTKNELGEGYGMKSAGSAYEWNEQAAFFASYVTGKTASEVAGIQVVEGKPAEADLASTVTIAIGGFQALIAKALG